MTKGRCREPIAGTPHSPRAVHGLAARSPDQRTLGAAFRIRGAAWTQRGDPDRELTPIVRTRAVTRRTRRRGARAEAERTGADPRNISRHRHLVPLACHFGLWFWSVRLAIMFLLAICGVISPQLPTAPFPHRDLSSAAASRAVGDAGLRRCQTGAINNYFRFPREDARWATSTSRLSGGVGDETKP
jgi:hypothetical protein